MSLTHAYDVCSMRQVLHAEDTQKLLHISNTQLTLYKLKQCIDLFPIKSGSDACVFLRLNLDALCLLDLTSVILALFKKVFLYFRAKMIIDF